MADTTVLGRTGRMCDAFRAIVQRELNAGDGSDRHMFLVSASFYGALGLLAAELRPHLPPRVVAELDELARQFERDEAQEMQDVKGASA